MFIINGCDRKANACSPWTSCYNDVFNLYPKILTFQIIQTRYISDLLKNCDTNKSTGTDDLYGRFPKDGADILTISITQICNLSIKFSHFPKDCKVAKLKPLYKKGTKTDPKNFRPISLLPPPIVSTIIKKVIHKQTMNYLTENNILYRHHLGFARITQQTLLLHIWGIKYWQALILAYWPEWFSSICKKLLTR